MFKLPIALVNVFCVLSCINGQVVERLYAINQDATINNISLRSSVTTLLRADREIPIPLTCNNPLQCILPQQSEPSSIYIPSQDNYSLILLEIQNERLYAYNITIQQCVLNDFVLLPNVDDYPVLMSCVLRGDGNVQYVLTNRYGNVTRRDVELVPIITAVVSPIILAVPGTDNDGNIVNDVVIVSIDTQNEIVTFKVHDSELDRFPLATDQPCAPVHIQKLRSDSIFLLTCQDDQQYIVNVTTGAVSFTRLPGVIMALSHNSRYSLSITSSNSTAVITIQEVFKQPAATRTVHLNSIQILAADFGPDDNFVYIASDREVTFINVGMALGGREAEQFVYTAVTIPICSACPPVVFLNSTFALVSSSISNNQFTLVQFFDFTSWPPLNSINRTLGNQPKLYWYDQYIEPTSVPSITTTPTILPSPSSSLNISPSGSTRQSDKLSGGAIAGIVVGGCLVFAIVFGTVIIIACVVCHLRQKGTDTVEPQPHVAPDQNQREQLVPGAIDTYDQSVTTKPVQASQSPDHINS